MDYTIDRRKIRSNQVSVNLNKEELDMLRKRAGEKNMGMSAFIRYLLNKELSK